MCDEMISKMQKKDTYLKGLKKPGQEMFLACK